RLLCRGISSHYDAEAIERLDGLADGLTGWIRGAPNDDQAARGGRCRHIRPPEPSGKRNQRAGACGACGQVAEDVVGDLTGRRIHQCSVWWRVYSPLRGPTHHQRKQGMRVALGWRGWAIHNLTIRQRIAPGGDDIDDQAPVVGVELRTRWTERAERNTGTSKG